MNYKYIEDEKYSKLINLCLDANDTPYSIHFCVYNINTELYIEGNKYTPDDIIEDDYLDVYELYNTVYPFLQKKLRNHVHKTIKNNSTKNTIIPTL